VTTDQVEYLAAYNRGASISNPRLRIAYVTLDTKIIVLLKLVRAISAYALKDFSTVQAAREWAAGGID
jgi:hypothetical protein